MYVTRACRYISRVSDRVQRILVLYFFFFYIFKTYNILHVIAAVHRCGRSRDRYFSRFPCHRRVARAEDAVESNTGRVISGLYAVHEKNLARLCRVKHAQKQTVKIRTILFVSAIRGPLKR